MSLRVVVGPMFAGKTSEIQSVVRRYSCLGKKVLVLTSVIDNRYQNDVVALVNHDQNAVPAKAISGTELVTVFGWPEYHEATAVVLDEAQFFDGYVMEFVRIAVDQHKKHVVVVGLDSDAERKPFTNVLELISQADSVEKKTALCRECGDGTPAIFTRALRQRENRVAVGGAEMYEPVCRRHFR